MSELEWKEQDRELEREYSRREALEREEIWSWVPFPVIEKEAA